MKRTLAFLLSLVMMLSLLSFFGTAPALAGGGENNSAFFAKNGLDKFLFSLDDCNNEDLPFKTGCLKKTNKSTIATITARWATVKFSENPGKEINIFLPRYADPASVDVKNKTIVAQFSDEDGYEWRGIRAVVKMRDSNAEKYGGSIRWFLADYYSGEYYDNVAKTKGDYQYSDFSVMMGGVTYDKCRAITWINGSSSSSGITMKVYVFFRVPAGYDGATVGFNNTTGTKVENGYSENAKTLMQEFKNGGIFFQMTDESGENDPLYTQEEALTDSEYKKWYKSCCSSISYKKLSRDPQKYDGRKVKLTGYVVQVCDEVSGYGWGYNEYRVATKGKYGNVVYVNIPGRLDKRILEGDKITIWGEYDGLKTYTTIFGGSVTIPEVTAEFYTIK